MPAHFKSTKEVIRILEKHRELPEDALLVSLDVVVLYSNIPIEDEACGEVYVGETERPVCERFQEHFRDAKTLAVRSPWGAHYREFHKALSSDPHFHPFHHAKIIAASSSLPTRRIKEAVSIERMKPEINQDSGWRLL